MRILVVDDNIDSAESLSEVIQMLGHQTLVGHDGLEAIRHAQTFRPQVLLLDIGLPHVSGHEAAKRIRQQPWGKDMLLIALSGWGQQEDRQKSREAGFDHHFVKPVDLDTLMKVVEQGRAA